MTKRTPDVPAVVTLRPRGRQAAVSAPAADTTDHVAAVPVDKLGGRTNQPHLGCDRKHNVDGRKPDPEHSALPLSEEEKRHFSCPEGSKLGVSREDPTRKLAAVTEAGSALHVGSSCLSPSA